MAGARLFINDKTIKKDGTSAVYALVHINYKSLKINTGVTVSPDRFDKIKGRVRGTSKEDRDENLIIDNCLSRINEIFVRYRLQQKMLTADLLLREYKNPSMYIDFYKFLETKINERVRNKEIAAVSGKHQKVLLHKLKAFKNEMCFAEIDLKLIARFKNHCRLHDGNCVNTIEKLMSHWICYMNLAQREGIIFTNPFDNYVKRRTEPNRVYLNEQELKKLIEIYEKNQFYDTLHRSLRHFLFMCFTGLRISDFMKLKPENVHDDNIKFVPWKTRVKKAAEITVPLIEKAKKLITDEKPKSGFLFDTITEQNLNEQLKIIAIKAEIDKTITNHTARHTFASLFLDKTNDVATLQRILGHSNIKETMIYVHISTKKISEQMGEFGRLLGV